MPDNRIRNIAFSLDLFLIPEKRALLSVRKKGPDAEVVPNPKALQLVTDRLGEDVQCVLVGDARRYFEVMERGQPCMNLTHWMRSKGVFHKNILSPGAVMLEDDLMGVLDLAEVDTLVTADETLAKRAVNHGVQHVYLLKLDYEGGRMTDDPRIMAHDDSQLLSSEIHDLTVVVKTPAKRSMARAAAA